MELHKRTPTGRRSTYFYHAVKEALHYKFSSRYIHMVKCGQRSNDDVLKAIISVDHNWQGNDGPTKAQVLAMEAFGDFKHFNFKRHETLH